MMCAAFMLSRLHCEVKRVLVTLTNELSTFTLSDPNLSLPIFTSFWIFYFFRNFYYNFIKYLHLLSWHQYLDITSQYACCSDMHNDGMCDFSFVCSLVQQKDE